MKLFIAPIVLVLALLIIAHAWRWSDNRMALETWQKLELTAMEEPDRFGEEMVDDLPEPARRYFLYSITTGTPLHTAAEIKMGGEIGLGPRENPGYMAMEGTQLLAPPCGFVWRLKTGKGPLKITGSEGSDGERSWIRFWLAGTIPIVRGGENSDHIRSAFGRVVAESVFWAPAAMLPQNGIIWQPLDQNTARATMTCNGLEQSVDVSVDSNGRPVKVVIARWSDANPSEIYQIQPFGGYLHDFENFDGFNLPTRIEGGNFIDTTEYFPFYKANVLDIRFIKSSTEK